MIVSVDKLLNEKIAGKVIVFPTDTVYGIGCLLSDEKSVEKIYAIKKRDADKPLAVLCGNLEDAKRLSKHYPAFERYAKAYWPGALTLVVKKTSLVPDFVTKGLDTVGLRIPNDPIARQILNHFGPMAVTSLNYSNEPAILKFDAVKKFINQVDFVVDGGNLKEMSSTVYDVENAKTLRQGSIVIS